MVRDGRARLWSRNGKDFTAKFPDIAQALRRQVDVDCVLDGELVVWTGERLDFDALQQRNVNTAATVRTKLAPARPAWLVVFDVLAIDDTDIRPMRWTTRRRRLESLAQSWRPPLQLSPVTADPDEAREWLAAFKSSGIEGLVVKGASTRYQPGRRDWVKVNSAGVLHVRLACVAGVAPGQRAVWRLPVVRDECCGRWRHPGGAAGRPKEGLSGMRLGPRHRCRRTGGVGRSSEPIGSPLTLRTISAATVTELSS